MLDAVAQLVPFCCMCVIVVVREYQHHRQVIELTGLLGAAHRDQREAETRSHSAADRLAELRRSAMAPAVEPCESWSRTDEDEWKIERQRRNAPGI